VGHRLLLNAKTLTKAGDLEFTRTASKRTRSEVLRRKGWLVLLCCCRPLSFCQLCTQCHHNPINPKGTNSHQLCQGQACMDDGCTPQVEQQNNLGRAAAGALGRQQGGTCTSKYNPKAGRGGKRAGLQGRVDAQTPRGKQQGKQTVALCCRDCDTACTSPTASPAWHQLCIGLRHGQV
jgi:hypothetical protein